GNDMLINTAVNRILVVARNSELLNNLRNILTSNSIIVDATDEMTRALSFLEKESYDAVFLDIEINDIFINDFIFEVKIAHPQILLILLINRSEISSINSFLKSGVDNFLIKPFDFNKLSSMLSAYPF
ncbi:MAG: response regulator, partial [Candidatus Cloacimonadota bacterium]|nr:response regulator [Candidatus Cloacimonadota bacterium]